MSSTYVVKLVAIIAPASLAAIDFRAQTLRSCSDLFE